MTGSTSDDVPRTVVPADIDTPDQIAWGLSFRQLAIIAGPTGCLWAAYTRFPTVLPALGWVGLAIVVLAVAVVVALGRRDGLPLDVWVRHGLSLRVQPRVLAPGTPVAGRELLVTSGTPVTPAPLRSPITRIESDGALVVEGSARAVIACGTTSVVLRTGTEQAALLEGFGRWLNALTGPCQILVRAARHDLAPHAGDVLEAAPGLPHPALRAAATEYAGFLLDLDGEREPLRRQVLAVVTGAHARDTSVRALTSLGITARPLDGPCVSTALAAALDPYNPPVPGPRAVSGTPITIRRTL
jgi:type IV secretory pathway TrbD component